MSPRRAALFLIACLAGVQPGLASQRDYLFRDELKCDQAGIFCLYGTLTYQPNPRLLRLRARVRRAPGPGLLRIVLVGETRQGHRRLAPLEVRVRGKPTEIINHKMVPDHPEALSWQVQFLEFRTEEGAAAPGLAPAEPGR